MSMFFGGVLYYLLQVVLFGAIAGLGIFVGIRLRKKKEK